MDSPVLNQLLRQLFRHPACQSFRSTPSLSARRPGCVRLSPSHPHHRQQCRPFLRKAPGTKKASNDGTIWNERRFITRDISEELQKYPMVTAKELRHHRERPRQVKMWGREFIDDSLYNLQYGYFSQHATIFSPGEPFIFNDIADGPAFHTMLRNRYTEFEDRLDEAEPDVARQLWHTPTELFQPYYGETIARYLVSNYKLTLYPYHDLIIYEMGAGNGTMMRNVLDYIREVDYEVYQRTKYKIIEISPALASLQLKNLVASAESAGHRDRLEIINRSIFDWNTYVHSPCFFLALEVFDNFSHDIIRYDLKTEQPQQGGVLIDADGEFHEWYRDYLDPVAARFLRVRQAAARRPFPSPLGPKYMRTLRPYLPAAGQFSPPEYIPTRLMQFFDILNNYFPGHRLVASDFSSLPDAVRGLNGPVVQTRFERRTIPVTTPYVQQGYFDIFFPTDFNVIEDMYRAITGKLTQVVSHEDFMQRWAYIADTETRNGENPMLTWYKNASMLMTV
ncbi:COG1565 domain protein [Aspergillus indologenus CBS 114.80]|uniref:Protein arginine methyltransferase NDUFAF7 n=1 Tax=Aspergillus indologenus CBS 114.80 TaxID=1450541 RepID=A0A2V5HQD7_9EURO|nr:COG1565 domain protein [Aspergillus indologenus CBS 114.80]